MNYKDVNVSYYKMCVHVLASIVRCACCLYLVDT